MSPLTLFLTAIWTIEIVTTERFSYPPMIALDSNTNPYILISKFRWNSRYYLLLYTKTNGNWIVDTFETNCSEPIYPPDLTIDARNRIWCIYPIIDVNNYVHLIVAHKDSTDWVKDTVESSPQLDFYTYSITCDSLDNPHIIYDLESARYAYYATFTGSGWRKEIFDSVPLFANYSGMSITFYRECHISFAFYFPNGRGELWYARRINGTWVKERLDTLFAEFLSSISSIAVSPEGFPRVAYWHDHPLGENPIVKYTYHNGTYWQIETVDTMSFIRSQRALVTDSSGMPYLVYDKKDYNDRKDRIAMRDSFGWHMEILPFTPLTDCSWGGSLRIARNGLIHIVRYATAFNDTAIHEVHYLYGRPEGIKECKKSKLNGSRLGLMALPSVVRENAQIQYAIPERQLIRLDLYDIIGRKVKTIAQGCVEPGIYSYRFDSSDLSSGVYFLVLEGERESRTRKLLIAR